MRTQSYKCNECEHEFYTDENLLRIGDYDQDNLIIRNPLAGGSLISMDNHDAIHFCSKECFIKYFFKDEDPSETVTLTSKSL